MITFEEFAQVLIDSRPQPYTFGGNTFGGMSAPIAEAGGLINSTSRDWNRRDYQWLDSIQQVSEDSYLVGEEDVYEGRSPLISLNATDDTDLEDDSKLEHVYEIGDTTEDDVVEQFKQFLRKLVASKLHLQLDTALPTTFDVYEDSSYAYHSICRRPLIKLGDLYRALR